MVENENSVLNVLFRKHYCVVKALFFGLAKSPLSPENWQNPNLRINKIWVPHHISYMYILFVNPPLCKW